MAEAKAENQVPRAAETVEEVVKKLNQANGISLDMTVQMMTSTDYKVRFVAEYVQCKIRYNNLHKMLVKMDAGVLEFTPDCPKNILMNQKSYMGQYLNQLEIRAEIEKIPLPHM